MSDFFASGFWQSNFVTLIVFGIIVLSVVPRIEKLEGRVKALEVKEPKP